MTSSICDAAEWQTFTLRDAGANSSFALPAAGAPASKLFAAPVFEIAPIGSSNFSTSRTVSRYADKLGSIDDKLLFGIETSAGQAGSLFSRSPFGSYDYNATTLKLGYDLGGFTPYLAGSVQSVKPAYNAGSVFTSPFEAGLNAQNPAFSASTAATVGAGFNYDVGRNTTFSLGVTVGNGSPALR
ncbi:MAG: hypothetical protein K2P80_04810 [Beijerinckiaceae bacterium]|nr:hypothetical protein [Beijerinckiaceae bacterium]